MKPSIRKSSRTMQWGKRTLLCLLLTGTAHAADFQSHESIRKAAESYATAEAADLDGKTVVTAGDLDTRLRLSRCQEPLETFTPSGRSNISRITVGVRCNSEKSWTLYVPVSISIQKEIAVATRELSRGQVLTHKDVRLEERDVAPLRRGYFQSQEEVIGKKLKRSIRMSDPITPPKITTPVAVKRGSKVMILASTGAIQVRMNGKALDNGSVGERIKVENQNSRREIEATVVGPGMVEVVM